MSPSGGLVSTCLIVLGSTAGGMLLSVLQSLDAATRSITGPQATLIIGAAGLAFQYGPRVVRWAAQRVAARRSKPGARQFVPGYFCAGCHKTRTARPTDICRQCVERASK